MDILSEDLQTSASIILSNDELDNEQKLARLRSLGIPEEIIEKIIKKVPNSSEWLTTDHSLNLVPISYDDLTVVLSEEFDYNDPSERDTVAGQSRHDSEFQSLELETDTKKMVKLRKYGDHSIYETPLEVSISRQALSYGFGEDSAQLIHIFFYYEFLCTLVSEESFFKPEKDGDIIVVFQKDAENIGSLQRMIAHLMVADGQAESVKSCLTKKLLENLEDSSEIDNVKNVLIPFERWEMLGKWSKRKNGLVQGLVAALTEECKGVRVSTSFEEQKISDSLAVPHSNTSSVANTSQLHFSPSVSNIYSLQKPEETTEAVENGHELSPKEAFLTLLEESLKEPISNLIENGEWSAMECLLSKQNQAVKDAYQQFKETHKFEHSQEFPERISPVTTAYQEEQFEEEQNDAEAEVEALRNSLNFNLTEHRTIVFMGETGAGKSTLINAIVNYLQHQTLFEAREKKPIILMPVEFEFQDSELRRFRVKCAPTIPVENEDLDNEYHGGAQSCTQNAKTYLFRIGPEECQTIRIIDTPGVADVRGLSQDKENFDRTLRYLSKYPSIDAILFVLKPNESTLSMESRYCIQQLLTHLHKSAANNLLFCFTNTQRTEYQPGDTLEALRQYFEDFYVERNIRITADEDTYFCFDNEAFRYLCAVKNGFHINQEHVSDCDESWNRSRRETLRLLQKIEKLAPHRTRETLSINNIRSMIVRYAPPLAKLMATLHINIEQLEREVQRIQELKTTLAELQREPTTIDLIEPVPVELPKPITVCTNEKTCITTKRYQSPALANYSINEYNTLCHNPCYLRGVQLEKVPNEDIKGCHCFKDHGINKCSNCDCPWDKHMHIRYKIEEITRRVENEKLKSQLEQAETDIDAKNMIIRKLRRDIEEREDEVKIIKKTSAECVLYLKKNACSPYNDVFCQVAEQLIREEQQKVATLGIPDTILHQMQKDLEEHKAQVSLFQKMSAHDQNERAKSIEEIDDLLTEVKNLPHCSKLLADVDKYEWMSIQTEQNNRETSVPLQDGWINRRN